MITRVVANKKTMNKKILIEIITVFILIVGYKFLTNYDETLAKFSTEPMKYIGMSFMFSCAGGYGIYLLKSRMPKK